jgi:O-antigen/teichoic acid export membrane protein
LKITLTFALQASQIMRQTGFILTSFLLAKSGLPISDIGVFESLLFIGTSVSYFWVNGLIQSLLAFMPTVKAEEKASVYFSISLIFIGLSAFIFLLLKAFPTFILTTLVASPTLPYFDLFSLYLLLNLAPFFLEGFWAVEKGPLSIIAFSGISNLLLPIAIAVPLWLKMDFTYSFYGLIIVALMRFIWLIIILIKNKNFTINYPQLNQFIKLSLPIMAYSLLNGFTMTFIFWIVSNHLNGNTAEFAIFRFGAREFPLVAALTTGLSNAFVPRIAASYELSASSPILEANSLQLVALKNKTSKLYHILFPISIILMLLSKQLFPIIFNPAFAKSADIFNIFLLLLISRALFPQTILLALKQTKTLLFISIIETIFIVLLSFFGIFWLDVIARHEATEASAWALIIGYLIEKGIIIYVLKRRYSIDFQAYTNVSLYFIYSVLLILAYIIQLKF